MRPGNGGKRRTVWEDNRSQSVVIGTILMFAIGVALLGLLQVTLIPSSNADVEAQHSQQVRGEMQDLRNDIQRSAASGADFSQGVKLGTEYPSRAFFLNPGPAAGSINTEGTDDSNVNVVVSNAQADNLETRDYWTGSSSESFGTGAVVYRPGYNVYSSAPDATVVENSLAYSEFNGNSLLSTEQRIVNGRQISLVALDGKLSQSQVNQFSVDTTAVSPATRTVPVTDGTGAIEIKITTRLSQETLIQDVFRNQIDNNGAGLAGVTDCSAISSTDGVSDRFIQGCDFTSGPGDFNTFTLVMEPGTTYNLKLAKVGVGTGATAEGPHYVTTGGSTADSQVDSVTREYTFEVRDRFNNPVSGVTLTLSSDDSSDELIADGNSGNTIQATTDEEGQVSVVYKPGDVPEDATETRTIRAESDFDGVGGISTIEEAEFTVDVVDAEADANVGSTINPAGPIILSDTRVSGDRGGSINSADCSDDNNECLVKFQLTHNDLNNNSITWNITDVRYHFYIAPIAPGAPGRNSPPMEVEMYDETQNCTQHNYEFQNNFAPASGFGPIEPNSTEVFVLDFNEQVTGNTNFKSIGGDGAIITLKFQADGDPSNTFSATYFLSPPADTGQGNNPGYDSPCA